MQSQLAERSRIFQAAHPGCVSVQGSLVKTTWGRVHLAPLDQTVRRSLAGYAPHPGSSRWLAPGKPTSNRRMAHVSFDHLVAAGASYSGNPAFRRPSITSFAFDCPPRAIHRRYCKGGIDLKQTRRRLTRLSVASEMGESGRETAVSWRIGGVLTLGFLPCDDGLVKATKLNKGHPHPSKRPV